MKRVSVVTVIGLIAGPVFATPEILPVKGIMGKQSYDAATGEQVMVTRRGGSLWASTWRSGRFFAMTPPDGLLDWGDIDSPVLVGGFDVGYATNANSGTPTIIIFYEEENGWNNMYHGTGRIAIAGFQFYAAGSPGPLYWGWITGLDFSSNPMLFDGNDIDPNSHGPTNPAGYMDFGYTYWFGPTDPPGSKIGPMFSHDPNAVPPWTDPGAEDAFDWFNDPNMGPNSDMNLSGYLGTYSFGGDPFGQFYLELFGPYSSGCPYPGEWGSYCTADIDDDCDVDMYDVDICLGIYPPDRCDLNGDGWFDLVDLSEILGQVGDNCRCPHAGQSGEYCTADIAGEDCAVNLSDLAKLLSNYGESGMTYWDGDIYGDIWGWPEVGNGTVDLADLAELLSQYGENCN